MKNYKGSASSGVKGYEFAGDDIVLRFSDGKTYLYSSRRPGKEHVDKMKKLAIAGKGLTTYVNQYVRDNYDAKLN